MSTALALIAPTLMGCQAAPMAYGEVIVEVHTDLPVPKVAGALRIDVYDGEGTWRETKDVVTPSAAEWPVSFSMVSTDLDDGASAYLRLRAYPQQRTRPYLGERYQERPSYTPPLVPASMGELCDGGSPPVVPPALAWVRRGDDAVTTEMIAQGDCVRAPSWRPVAAVNAVTVSIEQPGTYRFEVIERYPASSKPDEVLVLRAKCDDSTSQVTCNDQRSVSDCDGHGNGPCVVGQHLQSGLYTLLVGTRNSDSLADFRVAVALENEWPEDWEASPVETALPQVYGGDTPREEPDPEVTIDRLVAIDMVPGEVRSQVVALRGACAGTMARLSDDDPVLGVQPDAARSCIDTPDVRPLIREAPVGDEAVVTAGDDCSDVPPREDVMCIPSGWFLFGDRTAVSDHAFINPRRERVAHLDRFWLDRYEVTVGRFRRAIHDGMDAPPSDSLVSNSHPLGKSSANNPPEHCTWIDKPTSVTGDRNRYPISCISWQAAQAFCEFVGGSLPTESQWEYAATAAGRDDEVAYPWGGATAPTCADSIVFGRLIPTQVQRDTFRDAWLRVSDACLTTATGTGPEPVDSERGRKDRTARRVEGMGGNLSEWVKDAAYPYEHDCWRSQGPQDPNCLDEQPPLRSVRGGSWAFGASWLAGAIRSFKAPTSQNVQNDQTTYIGFRCAYDRPPAKPKVSP